MSTRVWTVEKAQPEGAVDGMPGLNKGTPTHEIQR